MSCRVEVLATCSDRSKSTFTKAFQLNPPSQRLSNSAARRPGGNAAVRTTDDTPTTLSLGCPLSLQRRQGMNKSNRVLTSSAAASSSCQRRKPSSAGAVQLSEGHTQLLHCHMAQTQPSSHPSAFHEPKAPLTVMSREPIQRLQAPPCRSAQV